jgi:hypothetical protein
LVLILLGIVIALGAAAAPGSAFWGPHALVDDVRVRLSSSPANTELSLARDRVAVARQKHGPEKIAWIDDAKSHLDAARADGAPADEVRAVQDEIVTLEVIDS